MIASFCCKRSLARVIGWMLFLGIPGWKEALTPSFGQPGLESVSRPIGSIPFQTWNTRSACAWVDTFGRARIQLHFKKVHRNQERFLSEVRIGSREKGAEIVRPLGHASDGSYTELEMDWEGESLRIESAQDTNSNRMVIRIIRLKPGGLPLRIALSKFSDMTVKKRGKRVQLPVAYHVYSLNREVSDPCIPEIGEYVLVEATDTTVFRVVRWGDAEKKHPPLPSIEQARLRYYQSFDLKSDTGLARFAVQSCMAWNTVYDFGKHRVLHTVNRMWNVNRGGYVIFCWDNLFGSLLSYYGMRDTSLAFGNFRAVLQDAAPEGFPTNNSQGNGRKALDRSQPPVGSLVAHRLYEQTGSLGFLRSVFPGLLRWNRWWMERRKNGPALCWGSHKAPNLFADPACHSLLGAKLETGLDDSPLWDSTRFDTARGLMELHDVGLNALYLADCEYLEKIAVLLGEKKAAAELKSRIAWVNNGLAGLYEAKDGLFLNHYLPGGSPSRLYAPTLLYPMLTSLPTAQQNRRMLDSLLYHPLRLGGEPGLPSISRNHPDFGKQRYWKGSVWPPLNYLVFRGLLRQNLRKEAEKLAQSSLKLFLDEYKRAKVVCENYSGMNGRCDDPKVDSEPYYFWGGLLALMQAELAAAPGR